MAPAHRRLGRGLCRGQQALGQRHLAGAGRGVMAADHKMVPSPRGRDVQEAQVFLRPEEPLLSREPRIPARTAVLADLRLGTAALVAKDRDPAAPPAALGAEPRKDGHRELEALGAVDRHDPHRILVVVGDRRLDGPQVPGDLFVHPFRELGQTSAARLHEAPRLLDHITHPSPGLPRPWACAGDLEQATISYGALEHTYRPEDVPHRPQVSQRPDRYRDGRELEGFGDLSREAEGAAASSELQQVVVAARESR